MSYIFIKILEIFSLINKLEVVYIDYNPLLEA